MKLLIIFFFSTILFAQEGIEWQKRFGGNSGDSLQKMITLEDGYLFFGGSKSDISGNITVNGFGGFAFGWLFKTDFEGNILWQKAYGGSIGEVAADAILTEENGFLLSFLSRSNISGNKSENSRGDYDYWIVNTDNEGNILWQKTIGGSGTELEVKAIPCLDGGYFVGGSSRSVISGDKTVNPINIFNPLLFDFWVLKLDKNKNIEWQRTIGGELEDRFTTVRQIADGGFIIGGYSNSNIGFDKSENSRGDSIDYWIIKLTPQGEIEWQKTIGSNDADLLMDIIITSQNEILLGGLSYGGISGDKTDTVMGICDIWIVKLSETGTILWQKSFGGDNGEWLYTISESASGTFYLAGDTRSSISGDVTGFSRGLTDFWVVEIDTNGNVLHDKRIGTADNDLSTCFIETNEGGYLLAGETRAGISGDKTLPIFGEFDIWVLKLDSQALGADSFLDTGFSFYPNPTSKDLHFNFINSFSGNISQYDTFGKKIKTRAFQETKNVTFELEGEIGMYLLKIENENNGYNTIKIIKND